MDIVCCLPCEHDTDSLRFCLADLFLHEDEPRAANMHAPRVQGFLGYLYTSHNPGWAGTLPWNSGLLEVAKEVPHIEGSREGWGTTTRGWLCEDRAWHGTAHSETWGGCPSSFQVSATTSHLHRATPTFILALKGSLWAMD